MQEFPALFQLEHTKLLVLKHKKDFEKILYESSTIPNDIILCNECSNYRLMIYLKNTLKVVEKYNADQYKPFASFRVSDRTGKISPDKYTFNIFKNVLNSDVLIMLLMEAKVLKII